MVSLLFFIVITLGISVLGTGSTQIGNAQTDHPQSNLTSTEKQLLSEGVSFQIDNMTFSHHMASVNGIQMHYVMGGHGDPLVLLHGYPQSWYEWRYVMPLLAKNYTVYCSCT